ncbi:hypothetical protein LY76DRAFT_113637 [Colletotrichum caudatum]|nr:hypothetical protein LY76DRAFT_113637 [Colletotrichum caudatum]
MRGRPRCLNCRNAGHSVCAAPAWAAIPGSTAAQSRRSLRNPGRRPKGFKLVRGTRKGPWALHHRGHKSVHSMPGPAPGPVESTCKTYNGEPRARVAMPREPKPRRFHVSPFQRLVSAPPASNIPHEQSTQEPGSCRKYQMIQNAATSG